MVLLEKRIRFRLVQKRKQSFGDNGARGGARVAALKERHRVERLLRGAQTKHISLPVVDYGEVIFGVAFERADREVEIARSERQ